MTAINRKLIFDAAKRRGAVFRTLADVRDMDAAIDEAVRAAPYVVGGAPPELIVPRPTHRRISAKGKALIHSFESCKLEAYKDPGSKNGLPITIGWGSTVDEHGRPFKLGVTITRDRADALFDKQIATYEQAVEKMVGKSFTDQSMFDALVSMAYNIGVGALQRSTVMRKHLAGDHAGAAAAFGMWVKNDGVTLRGLVRRRAAEAALYLADG